MKQIISDTIIEVLFLWQKLLGEIHNKKNGEKYGGARKTCKTYPCQK